MNAPAWLRSPAGLVIIVSLVLGIAGTLSLAAEIGQTFGGYFSQSAAHSETGQVDPHAPVWGPLAGQSFAASGEFLTVNDRPYTQNVRAVFAETTPGELVMLSYVPVQGTQATRLAVPALTFSFNRFLEFKFPQILLAISFWLLAIIVLRARPHGPTNQIFAVLTAIIAAHALLTGHTLFLDHRWLPNLLESLLLFLSAVLGAVLFHFAWLYPSPLNDRPQRLIAGVYLVGVTLGVIHLAERFPWWPGAFAQPDYPLTWYSFRGILLLYLLGVIALVVRLSYSGLRPSRSKRELKIVLITVAGIVVALPRLIVPLTELLPNRGPQPYWNSLDLRLFVVAIPFALALAIVRYQSMRAPSRLFILVAALAGSALLAHVLSWLWLGPQLTVVTQELVPPFIPLFIGIFLASLFWGMQTTWQGWLGRFFQREALNYDATLRFGRVITSTGDQPTLPQRIAETIVGELELECAAIWLANEQAGRFELAARAGQTASALPEQILLPRTPPAGKTIPLLAAEEVPAWLLPLTEGSGIEVAAPLYEGTTPVALAGFGRRWDEEIFDTRDLAIIELIGQQSLLYLQVARQIEELRRVPHLVSSAQERERTLLAAELHDTIQQFLGKLPFFLLASKEAMVEDPAAAGELLEQSLRDIEQATQTVQQIRHNLAPSQLELSLTRPVSALIGHVQQRHEVQISFNVTGDVDGATSVATRHALYRVIQHALDNAVTHAGAGHVTVSLQQANGQVSFTVTDDGRGSTGQERRLAQAGGHFGLQSMQARIEACGGAFQFASAAGEGTRVSGWVPANTSETE